MHSHATTRWLAGAIALLLFSPLTADEASVRDAISDYVTAFNAEDLAAIESMWADDAVYVDHALGERTEGRSAILSDIEAVFAGPDQLKLSGTVESVRLVLENVANVAGTVSLANNDGDMTTTSFSALLVMKDNAWQIHSMEEFAIQPPASAADALAELDWLIGSWVDATGQSPVRANVRASIGGAFLVRTFQTEEADGTEMRSTQVIGYDPRSMQIRSWTFNADGSFGDGIWTRAGNDWLVKSTQTLADGSAASGTYVMKPQNEEAFTVQLIGSEIEGEPQPASAVMTVKRAPQEAVDSVSPSSTTK